MRTANWYTTLEIRLAIRLAVKYIPTLWLSNSTPRYLSKRHFRLLQQCSLQPVHNGQTLDPTQSCTARWTEQIVLCSHNNTKRSTWFDTDPDSLLDQPVTCLLWAAPPLGLCPGLECKGLSKHERSWKPLKATSPGWLPFPLEGLLACLRKLQAAKRTYSLLQVTPCPPVSKARCFHGDQPPLPHVLCFFSDSNESLLPPPSSLTLPLKHSLYKLELGWVHTGFFSALQSFLLIKI